MKLPIVLSPIFLLVFLSACGSSRASYRFNLQQVARGAAFSDESRSIKPPLVFEGADFRLTWSPGPLTFYFRLDNRSKSDIQINYDKSFLLSPRGDVYAPVHPGNSSIAKGDNFVVVPAMAGVDSWIRPGQKQGENDGGLVSAIAPGFDGGGFFPEQGDAAEIKKEYAGKTATVVLNLTRAGKAESFRFTFLLTDVVEE
ncbi:MAG TPA: hypothetical protein PKW28_09720 [Turneriella sp.]|nr:hypothetical protein [Turneriella sp.]HNJ66163.1 hypothetical protein [Turneriella sp.]HNL53593.1 hypothetical protein [Turneriella sp.]